VREGELCQRMCPVRAQGGTLTDRLERARRLRLARRRPAPRTVRALVPEPGVPEPDAQPDPAPDPEPVPALLSVRERLRRAGWTHVISVSGAALAAVAAIGGLWAQAVAAYWTQQTARDQLSQSRDESRQQAQTQAAQVTIWEEGQNTLQDLILHVLNRSPAPVTSVQLGGLLYVKGVLSDRFYFADLPDLGPCTEYVYNLSKTRLAMPLNSSAKEGAKAMKDFTPESVSFRYLSFADTYGGGWRRSWTGLEEITPGDFPIAKGLVALPTPRVAAIQTCGGGM